MKNNKEYKGDPCKATGCMADVVCGIWKSTSLFPVLLVYKDHAKYKLCIMRIIKKTI